MGILAQSNCTTGNVKQNVDNNELIFNNKVMINYSSVRPYNREKFKKCIELRKIGHSYNEIRKVVPVAKSTLNNWITFAGLNLTAEYLHIQVKKRLENHKIATMASKITRQKRKDGDIQNALENHKQNFNDPFYNYGIALYESEGSKGTGCKFSNSDYRVIATFIRFIEKYFALFKSSDMGFSLYIHETRSKDLNKIKGFWARKVEIPVGKIKVYWKKTK